MKTFKRITAAALFGSMMMAGSSLIAEEVSYGYDEQGRLVAVYYENGKTLLYSYDAAGNRILQKVVMNGIVAGTENNPTYDLVVLPLIGGYAMPFNIGSGAYGGPVYSQTSGFVLDITHSSGAPLDIRTLANAQGYVGGDATVTVTVSSDITGSSGGGAAIKTGTWPDQASIKLTLNIEAGVKIYGGGGNGGAIGGAGGNAIQMSEGLAINNSGTLKGGSGGGYRGLTEYRQCNGGEDHYAGGGGGGGGWPNGLGGSGGSGSAPPDGSFVSGQSGKNYAQGGLGGSGGTNWSCGSSFKGGTGGRGGTFPSGINGNDGQSSSAGTGGKGGLSVVTNDHALICTNSGSGTGCP